jgi:hypothetical protein
MLGLPAFPCQPPERCVFAGFSHVFSLEGDAGFGAGLAVLRFRCLAIEILASVFRTKKKPTTNFRSGLELHSLSA